MRLLIIFGIMIAILLIICGTCTDFMLDTFYPRVYTLDPHKEYYHPLNNKPIPKIIHQLAPADKSKWVKSWFDGHKSVKKFFPEPEFKHMMWTDEKIYDFVYKVFPQYYDTFMSYPYLINKIDMVRYMILYVYGGIYIDMDFIISKNFYPLLSVGKIHLIRSVWFFNEKYQNSMMASPQGEEFWLNILEIGFNGMRDPKVYNKYIKKKKSLFTITMTGPRLLDALVSHSNRDKIQNIPYYGYGKHMNSSVYTKGTNGLKNI